MGGFDYGGKMIYSPMMQQYLQTKDEYKDSILLYRLGDFYEMFFDDAIKASEILDLVLTSKVCGQKCKAPMCGIPYHAVDNYIAKLIEAGEKVAICEQLSEPNSRELVKRGVVRVVTPGTGTSTLTPYVRSDTTLPFTVRQGQAYCFKMTVVNGNAMTPGFTVGNGDVLKTQFVAKIGNDYYYRVYATGTPGQSTGVYTTLPGQNAVKHCTVTIG